MTSRPKPTESKPRTGGFHCGKDHWLSRCPDLDEAAKEALLAERKSKKKSNDSVSKNFRAKRLEQDANLTMNERATVLLNDRLELPYCADSGCDWNVISRKPAGLLQEQDSTVQLVELNEPVESQAVGGMILTSTLAVDVRRTINTAAGPLGIDTDQQLEYLASRRTEDDDSFDEPVSIPPCKRNELNVIQNVVDALVHDAIARGVVDNYLTTR
ncbi:unnamed protein product [Phytophthora fragariaefolia]|uniref:Unnamed protein product n=1 Tax=Phytophthora fragariaefolia TaxID=1490495 RepID=A0A9W6WKU5_9STRA|nr:unnamed protein product [Phytophthora fragariaefolia]